MVVDATSGDTGNADRDEKMNAEVLTSAAFPEVVLIPRRVSGDVPASNKGTLTVEGVLRLLGVEHPVSIPVAVEADGDAVHLTATFTVPFVAWGLHDPSVFVLRVDKEVKVAVDARGTLSAPSAAGPAPGVDTGDAR